MAWTVKFLAPAKRKLGRLGPDAQQRITSYLKERLEDCDDPRLFGKALTGQPSGRWRYRAGDYRIICRLDDDEQKVLVLSVGHRRDVYR
ncbi:MAG: type II toxin-antitoxin system RelE/ParE family toxin [Proteobacteria bacterium]|nr:type II toxin-antitoxin system RelE/ParE family toxin [Pseudomonadota bacterium]